MARDLNYDVLEATQMNKSLLTIINLQIKFLSSDSFDKFIRFEIVVYLLVRVAF